MTRTHARTRATVDLVDASPNRLLRAPVLQMFFLGIAIVISAAKMGLFMSSDPTSISWGTMWLVFMVLACMIFGF
eukprot:COSAG02_NODE_20312_length_838_cov_0.983762_2_plen_74_part_01